MSKQKLLIIGLDCLTPQLVFERWIDELPNFKKLMNSGIWGKLESTIPCITVPAWSSMVTGKDPGELGFYGFRNRKDYSYDNLFFANSTAVKEPTIWNILSKNRKSSIVLGVPQTYPVKPIRGVLVSSFLAPDETAEFTYPAHIKNELNSISGGYQIDVKGFRTENKKWLLDQIYSMTEKRFKVVKEWLKTKDWDLFMFVEMGPDRIHHGLWGYCEPDHPNYNTIPELTNSIKHYYKYLDSQIGEIITQLDENTTVMIVSDHGAKTMIGGVCINEWLIKEDLLTVKKYPSDIEKFSKDNIDWDKTYCWGEGGYYSRIFFNIKNREPQGIIEANNYKEFQTSLKKKLESITDEKGNNIKTKAFIPEEIYNKVNGIAPDLMVYFGNLNYRSIGSIGYNNYITHENDTGPDDANHAQHGIFIKANIADLKNGKIINNNIDNLKIYDIAPTVINFFNIDSKKYEFKGKIINAIQ